MYHALAGGTTSGVATNGNVQLLSAAGQPLLNTNSTSGFYTVAYLLVNIDVEPPVISLTIGKAIAKGTSQQVSPVITDNFNKISEAKIYFRPIGSKQPIDQTSRNLVRNGTTATYTATLEASDFDAMGIEFYLTAKDPAGNLKRFPEDPDKLYIYTIDKSTIPASLLSFGTDRKNYRMISVPFDFQENISKLLDEFGDNDNTQWRLKTYGGGTSFLEYPSDFSTFERGRGYWLIARQSKELVLSESIQAPENNQRKLHKITLRPGWNQIGNPYTVAINWEDVRAYHPDEPIGKLKLYNGAGDNGGYYNGDEKNDFLTYQGGFVYFDGAAARDIEIPFKGQAPGGRQGGRKEQGWQLAIEIRDGDVVNRLGGIGMNPQALTTKDRFDDHNPPRFMDFAEINFVHPEHPLKSFCFDVVPALNEYTWGFTVNTSSGSGELHWGSADLNGKDLFLYDEQAGRIIDMQVEHRYAVATASGRLKIYYGTDVKDKIRPGSVQVGAPFPNPFQHELEIPFALPGQDERFQVSVDIFNGLGQRVRNVAQGQFSSGIHSAVWNGDSDELISCAPGLFFYRVVVSQNGKDVTVNGRVLKTN